MYKALVSFSGKITMIKGEVKEITDKALVEDLTSAGFIEKTSKKIRKRNC